MTETNVVTSNNPLNKKAIIIIAVLSLSIIGGITYYILANKPNLSGFDLARGKQVYEITCIGCHLPGQFGAPKVGEHKEWAPRIAKGIDVLMNNGINGLNEMPPRGGNAKLSDEEVKDAVAFMISESWW